MSAQTAILILMASIVLPVSQVVEEFFNRNHSRQDGKFTSGSGGRSTGARPNTVKVHDGKAYNTLMVPSGKAASHFKNGTGGRTPVFEGKHTKESVQTQASKLALKQRHSAMLEATRRSGSDAQPSTRISRAHPGTMKAGQNASTGASLKNGQIHLGGKAVTGKVRKDGNMWEAKLLGKEHSQSVMSGQHNSRGHALYKNEQNSIRESTRAGLVKAVERHLAGQAADKRIGDAKSKAAYSPAQNNADGRRLNTMSSLVVEGLRHHGPTKASQVSVSKDGSVKIKGQAQDFIKIGRGATESGRSGYTVTGANIQSSRGASIPKIFKTQAAAKMEVAKRVSAASLVN